MLCVGRAGKGAQAPSNSGRKTSRTLVVALAPATPEPAGLLTLEDVAAELALQLRSSMTPASAKAALAREYRATLAEIERAKPKVKDGIDMLAERRASRGA